MATRTRTWERRMVCRECGRTIDVLRAPADGGGVWEGRADRDALERRGGPSPVKRRPTGLFARHQLVGRVADALLLDPLTAVAYCHRDKCGRIIPLDMDEVSRLCRETRGDRFEV